jgi:hypothetical protein
MGAIAPAWRDLSKIVYQFVNELIICATLFNCFLPSPAQQQNRSPGASG